MHDGIHIVLCNTKHSTNIGFTCRAMKTMGLTKLRLVAPAQALDPMAVASTAVHAFDVFEGAEHFDSVADAVADIDMVVATTRRTGKRRTPLVLTARELPTFLETRSPASTAILFGNEEHGLTTEQVQEASAIVSIPTSPAFPSLNLSHSVQVLSYELFSLIDGRPRSRGASRESRRNSAREFVDAMAERGMFVQGDPDEYGRFLSDMLERAAVTDGELKRLSALFRKLLHHKSNAD